jgi:prepilin-type N-terminal cleavage/methylation domain-containing protein
MLKRLLSSRPKGFTLIEVVIVLAIAGLIFVIVFLAVSQAQASRRDTQRKADMDRLSAGVESYATNNSGAVPNDLSAAGAPIVGTYVTDFSDPSIGTYTEVDNAPAAVGQYNYIAGGVGGTDCSGAPMTGTRNYKIQAYIERGGNVFCVDNT